MGELAVAENVANRGETRRFRAKRDAILAAASEAINEQSAKGMTFADVARRVGLNTTSVTYYFKRKDDLAAACFQHTLDYLGAMLDEALTEATPAGAGRAVRRDQLRPAGADRARRGTAVRGPVRPARDGCGSPARRCLPSWRAIFRKTRSIWTPQNRPRPTWPARARTCCSRICSGCRSG